MAHEVGKNLRLVEIPGDPLYGHLYLLYFPFAERLTFQVLPKYMAFILPRVLLGLGIKFAAAQLCAHYIDIF